MLPLQAPGAIESGHHREHLAALGAVVDEAPERLLQGLEVPAGEVPLHDAEDGEGGAPGQLSPALRIVLLAQGVVPEERRGAVIGERVATGRLRHFLHALDERFHGLRKPGTAVLLDPVTGDRRVLDGSEIRFPQLGDGVFAAGRGTPLRIGKRHVHEIEQLFGGETALEGDGPDPVAVQPEAQPPFAWRLGVDGLPFEGERSLLHRDGDGGPAREYFPERREHRLDERGVLPRRVAVDGDALERPGKPGESIAHQRGIL